MNVVHQLYRIRKCTHFQFVCILLCVDDIILTMATIALFGNEPIISIEPFTMLILFSYLSKQNDVFICQVLN